MNKKQILILFNHPSGRRDKSLLHLRSASLRLVNEGWLNKNKTMDRFGSSRPSSRFGINQPYKIPQRKPSLTPVKPKTVFEEKKDWARDDFMRKAGKGLLESEKKKLDKAFSPKFGTYISEGEAKSRLRELRGEEYKAKTGKEKSEIRKTKQVLEKGIGLKGKY